MAALAGLAFLAGAKASVGGGGSPTPPKTWSPKWSVGDNLRSHNLPDATWTVLVIEYQKKAYWVRFQFAGANTEQSVDAINLEGMDIYRV